jgi:hypothetical protein
VNVEVVRNSILTKTDEPLVARGPEVESLLEINSNADVVQYLRECLTSDGFLASGVDVKGLSGLVDENLGEAAPGCFLRSYGMLVIATSIGGNAVCVDRNGAVHWADHSSFYEDQVSYKLPSGEWRYEPVSKESVQRALIALSASFESFLMKLLNDELMDELDSLD